MATEIERKFLVAGDGWRAAAAGPPRRLAQAYLAGGAGTTVRVRIVDDAEAFLTIKGISQGATRAEFEYPLPLADADGGSGWAGPWRPSPNAKPDQFKDLTIASAKLNVPWPVAGGRGPVF